MRFVNGCFMRDDEDDFLNNDVELISYLFESRITDESYVALLLFSCKWAGKMIHCFYEEY